MVSAIINEYKPQNQEGKLEAFLHQIWKNTPIVPMTPFWRFDYPCEVCVGCPLILYTFQLTRFAKVIKLFSELLLVKFSYPNLYPSTQIKDILLPKVCCNEILRMWVPGSSYFSRSAKGCIASGLVFKILIGLVLEGNF